jgi:DNA-binding XRE family transcriptional regulator
LAEEISIMSGTNFDDYLSAELEEPRFASRFRSAESAWDLVLELTKLRQSAGVSQKEMAERLHTKQQNISRLESPSYRGHSLKTIFDYADALGVCVKFGFEPRSSSGEKSPGKSDKRPNRKKPFKPIATNGRRKRSS